MIEYYIAALLGWVFHAIKRIGNAKRRNHSEFKWGVFWNRNLWDMLAGLIAIPICIWTLLVPLMELYDFTELQIRVGTFFIGYLGAEILTFVAKLWKDYGKEYISKIVNRK